ncbi:MAG: hypothetical protein WC682_04325 [Parcubacteria group bacterium]|jgi:hypothetical protein
MLNSDNGVAVILLKLKVIGDYVSIAQIFGESKKIINELEEHFLSQKNKKMKEGLLLDKCSTCVDKERVFRLEKKNGTGTILYYRISCAVHIMAAEEIRTFLFSHYIL